jgi:hypothetical protein
VKKEARDVFCSISKRERGKRGPARHLYPDPSKDADRKRRAREPHIEFKIVRELTTED